MHALRPRLACLRRALYPKNTKPPFVSLTHARLAHTHTIPCSVRRCRRRPSRARRNLHRHPSLTPGNAQPVVVEKPLLINRVSASCRLTSQPYPTDRASTYVTRPVLGVGLHVNRLVCVYALASCLSLLTMPLILSTCNSYTCSHSIV